MYWELLEFLEEEATNQLLGLDGATRRIAYRWLPRNVREVIENLPEDITILVVQAEDYPEETDFGQALDPTLFMDEEGRSFVVGIYPDGQPFLNEVRRTGVSINGSEEYRDINQMVHEIIYYRDQIYILRKPFREGEALGITEPEF